MTELEAFEFELNLTSTKKTIIFVNSFDSLTNKIKGAYNTSFGDNSYSIMCRITKGEALFDLAVDNNFDYRLLINEYAKNSHLCGFFLKITLSLNILVKNAMQHLDSSSHPLVYSTMDGLDDAFYEQLNRLAEQHCNDDKDSYCLSNSKLGRHELTEENIFKLKIFSILFTPPKGYAGMELADVEHLIKLPSGCSTLTQLIKVVLTDNGVYRSDSLIEIVNNNTMIIPEFDSKVAHVMQGLSYITNCLPKDTTVYNETTRRMMINYFLLSAVSFEGDNTAEHEVLLRPEYQMDLSKTHRIGNGPLDYYVLAAVPVITSSVKDPPNVELEDSGEVTTEEHITIVEAKVDLDAGDLKHSLPQLIAQMFDGLNLESASTSRKRDRDGQSKSEIDIDNSNNRVIKGVLSNGHHNLFFSLSQRGAEKPQLQYYGRYAVKVLPNKKPKDSGLDIGQKINRNEVATLIRALHFFARLDVI